MRFDDLLTRSLTHAKRQEEVERSWHENKLLLAAPNLALHSRFVFRNARDVVTLKSRFGVKPLEAVLYPGNALKFHNHSHQ